ncbi:MAG: SpoIIE family protein phosphatase [Thermodesulfobacteriota bacterium]
MERLGIRSFTIEVAVLVMLGSSILLGLLFGFSYVKLRDIVVTETEYEARNLAGSAALKIEQELRAVSEIAENLAICVQDLKVDEQGLLRVLKEVVRKNPELYGSTVSYEPYAFRPDVEQFAPYYCQSSNGPKFVDLTSSQYSYLQQDWYLKSKTLQRPKWTHPYFDEGGGDIIMTTFLVPFFHVNEDGTRGAFRGVATADLSIDWLKEKLSSLAAGRWAYCFVISQDGMFLTAPVDDWIMKESIFTLAEKEGKAALRHAGDQMLKSRSGFVDVGTALPGGDAFLAHALLSINGWALGAVFPKEELFAPLRKLHHNALILGLCILILLLAVSFIIARSITRPLQSLTEATTKVAEGDLDVDLSSIRRSDELGRLAQSFSKMTVDLKSYIKELTAATAARERIEGELGAAAQIQRSMLPATFPAFPDRDDFDVYAVMIPAKEVGGDLYQFFLLEDGRLCFAIGDVAGKGVPAALYMAVTTYLLKAAADQDGVPEQILLRLNRQLSLDNDSAMFVTFICCMLDLQTGELRCANGGHNPPLLVRRNGEVSFLGHPGGPVVGIFEDVEFVPETLTLQPGDSLLLYTDGVTEAFNNSGELFSSKRLQEEVSQSTPRTVSQLVSGVLAALRSFTGDAEQSDDMTMIAVQFKGQSD